MTDKTFIPPELRTMASRMAARYREEISEEARTVQRFGGDASWHLEEVRLVLVFEGQLIEQPYGDEYPAANIPPFRR